VVAYRDSLRLLVRFAYTRTGVAPSRLDFADLDAALVGAFLQHLESDRGNCVRTRNARLAAVRSLFHYAAFRHPEHADLIAQVLAIPAKRQERAVVDYLDPTEINAMIGAPDRSGWLGRRDHALLVVALQTGLRVSELVGLCCGDIHLGAGAHLRCHGKGRKERITPLTKSTVAVLRFWLEERGGGPTSPAFPTRQGHRLSPDAVAKLVAKHAVAAALAAPSLRTRRITPHTLRHTTAMTLLRAGVDITVIALWLGHEQVETTNIYLHADLSIKERAIALTAPPEVKPGRYRPPDQLLAFLEGL
jgi:site-specific recombinase XerD